MARALAVTFDVGQVLAGFDSRALAEKLEERGGGADADAIERALPQAWEVYSRTLRAGGSATAGWKDFIRSLMLDSGAQPVPDEALLGWLYEDNVPRNLWRRPIEGMIALLHSLRRAGVRWRR